MKRFLPALAAIVALVVVVMALVLTLPSSSPGFVVDVAEDFPPDTLAFVAFAPPSQLVELMEETDNDGVDSSDMLGPYSPQGFRTVGLDPDQPIGIGWLDVEAETVVVSLGLEDPEVALESLPEILDAFDYRRVREPEPMDVGDVDAYFVDASSDPVGVVIDGNRMLLILAEDPSSHADSRDSIGLMPSGDTQNGALERPQRRHRSRSEREREGIRVLVRRVAEAINGENLVSETELDGLIASTGQAVAGAFLNFGAMAAQIEADDDTVANIRWLFQQLKGAGVTLSQDGTAVHLISRLAFWEDSNIAQIFDMDATDTNALDHVPGPILIGVHGSINDDALFDSIEDLMRLDQYSARNFQESLSMVREELGISVRDDLIENFNGVFGYFLSRLPTESNPMDFDILFYVGIEDVDEAQSMLDRTFGWLEREMSGSRRYRDDEQGPRVTDIEGVSVYHMPIERGLAHPALAVYGEHLWFSLHQSLFRRIIRDEVDHYTDDNRALEISDVLTDGTNIAAVIDLREFVDWRISLVNRQHQDSEGLESLLTVLDWGSVTLDMDGNHLVIETVVHTTEASPLGRLLSVPTQRYHQRSLTTEAIVNLRRLYDSSVAYYETDHLTPDGRSIAPRFPRPVPLTPPQVPCGESRIPHRSDWTDMTWEALNFTVSDPHYFSYQYESEGVGIGSTFTATAFGDLDCDGVFSTFVRLGLVSTSHEVQGGAGIYQTNELE